MKIEKEIFYSEEKLLLAQRLKEFVFLSGLSKKFISHATKMQCADLNRILNGRANLTDDTRMNILAVLNVTLKEFFNVQYLDKPLKTIKKQQEEQNELNRELKT